MLKILAISKTEPQDRGPCWRQRRWGGWDTFYRNLSCGESQIPFITLWHANMPGNVFAAPRLLFLCPLRWHGDSRHYPWRRAWRCKTRIMLFYWKWKSPSARARKNKHFKVREMWTPYRFLSRNLWMVKGEPGLLKSGRARLKPNARRDKGQGNPRPESYCPVLHYLGVIRERNLGKLITRYLKGPSQLIKANFSFSVSCLPTAFASAKCQKP